MIWLLETGPVCAGLLTVAVFGAAIMLGLLDWSGFGWPASLLGRLLHLPKNHCYQIYTARSLTNIAKRFAATFGGARP